MENLGIMGDVEWGRSGNVYFFLYAVLHEAGWLFLCGTVRQRKEFME